MNVGVGAAKLLLHGGQRIVTRTLTTPSQQLAATSQQAVHQSQATNLSAVACQKALKRVTESATDRRLCERADQ